jgi:beta-glucosidase
MSTQNKYYLDKYKAQVDAIMDQMSLEQKIGQIVQTERMAISPEQVKENYIGSILSGGGSVPGDNNLNEWVEMNDAFWQASMSVEKGPKIPIIYGVDAIHGHNNAKGAVVFPHNIGLGAMRNPQLVEQVAQVTAKEILASGVDWTFAPTLAVARDIRWGRTYESYSENPEVVKSYAAPFVHGLQGNLGKDSVVACLKHWVGDGGTEYGIDQGETSVSEEELRNIHMAAYIPAIEAGAMTVMVSFNSWHGNKCHGHKYLVTDVLKKELGFEGFVISDWDGINYISDDFGTAIREGINAGIDMFMVSEDWAGFIGSMKYLIGRGDVSMERLDDAVRRILTVKMAFGLFEKPRPKDRIWSNDPSFGSEAHRKIARQAVSESLVMLKNKNNILPLQNNARILVAGKNANDCGHLCGGFTIAWQGVSDVEKISNAFPEGISSSGYNSSEMGVQKGSIEGGTSIWEGIEKEAPNAFLNLDGSKADPKLHDVAVVVIGETPYAEGMGDIRKNDDVIAEMGTKIKGLMKVLAPYGHSLNLKDLHPEDLATIKRITDKGIPVVTILVSGRPLIVNEELEASDAFVAAWLPGSEGGGVSDVLFGKKEMKGKLSFTWQKHAEDHFLVGDEPYEPLFPFGYGLEYDKK